MGGDVLEATATGDPRRPARGGMSFRPASCAAAPAGVGLGRDVLDGTRSSSPPPPAQSSLPPDRRLIRALVVLLEDAPRDPGDNGSCCRRCAAYQRSWAEPRRRPRGLVLSALLVPQGMAYAELAGLPPSRASTPSILCLVAYALVGPSHPRPRSRLGARADDRRDDPAFRSVPGDPVRAVLLASALAIATGLLMLGAGLGKGSGRRRPALQTHDPGLHGRSRGHDPRGGSCRSLLGLGRLDSFLGERGGETVKGIASGSAAAAAASGCSLVIILILDRWLKTPNVLVGDHRDGDQPRLRAAERGVRVIGRCPRGCRSSAYRSWRCTTCRSSLSVPSASRWSPWPTRSRRRPRSPSAPARVDGNQREMIGIGAANIRAGLFQGFPVSTSGSRTAVAESAGAEDPGDRSRWGGNHRVMLVAFPVAARAAAAADPRRDRHRAAHCRSPTSRRRVVSASRAAATSWCSSRRSSASRCSASCPASSSRSSSRSGPCSPASSARTRPPWAAPRACRACTTAPATPTPDRPPAARLPLRRAADLHANLHRSEVDVLALAYADPRPQWIVVAAEPMTDIDTSAADISRT